MILKTLILERFIKDNKCTYRTIIKNNHARTIYFEISLHETGLCEIVDLWYADRNIGKSLKNKNHSSMLHSKVKLKQHLCKSLAQYDIGKVRVKGRSPLRTVKVLFL